MAPVGFYARVKVRRVSVVVVTFSTNLSRAHRFPFYNKMTNLVYQVRQNFRLACEKALNKLANLEFHASYSYMCLAYHFDRDDVAMEGFRKFFLQRSHEENEAAEKILAYQNLRGGRVTFLDILKPDAHTWESSLAIMQTAMALEMRVNQAVLELHALAGEVADAQMCDWLEEHFFQQKLENIKKIGDYITIMKKVGDGLGEYLFERKTLAEK